MSIEYVPDKDLQNAVDDLIRDCADFALVRELKIGVLTSMKVNTNAQGENKPCTGCPVTTKRIGPAERSFVKDNAQFLIVMDYTIWNESNENQRTFWVHHGLMRIKVEKKDDSLKVGTRPPEFALFKATIVYCGLPFDFLLNLRDVLANGRKVVSMVENLAEKAQTQSVTPLEVIELEPDLPPPRRAKRVGTSG